jgi:hypothetical protein
MQDRKITFLNASTGRRTVNDDRLQAKTTPYVVQAGTVIPEASLPACAPIFLARSPPGHRGRLWQPDRANNLPIRSARSGLASMTARSPSARAFEKTII